MNDRINIDLVLDPKRKKAILYSRRRIDANPDGERARKRASYHKHKATAKAYADSHKAEMKLLKARMLLERPWYWSWIAAQARCNNPKHERYPAYGGRGIKFLMTEAQIEHLWFRDNAELMDHPTIDRINNNGNYEVSNCRFLERADNLRKSQCNGFEIFCFNLVLNSVSFLGQECCVSSLKQAVNV